MPLGGVVQQMLVCNSPKKLSTPTHNGSCDRTNQDLEIAKSLAASERPALGRLKVEPPSNLPGEELP